MSTIFARIIAGSIPCNKVFENPRILAFWDIAPVAPVHLLIVPKKSLSSLAAIAEEDLPLLGECLWVAKILAEEFEIVDGYRLLTNNGSEAGQTVFHLHFHLIGGRELGALG